MKYTHIVADVGAAEKYYEVIWINPDELKDIINYLRDFHDLMHIFRNCGKFVSNRAFEEILYQARICSAGGIRPVLSRKSVQHVVENSRSNTYI